MLSNSNNEKWVWVIIGPNGAGKSTFRRRLPDELKNLPYIDHDALVSSLKSESPGISPMDACIQAGEISETQARHFLREGQSFIVEKVLAEGAAGYSFKVLKQMGWKTGAIIIGVATPEISKARVEQRVKNGGHPFLMASLTKMWHFSLMQTQKVVSQCDRALIYDNSGAQPILMAEKKEEAEELSYKLPAYYMPPGNRFMDKLFNTLGAHPNSP